MAEMVDDIINSIFLVTSAQECVYILIVQHVTTIMGGNALWMQVNTNDTRVRRNKHEIFEAVDLYLRHCRMRRKLLWNYVMYLNLALKSKSHTSLPIAHQRITGHYEEAHKMHFLNIFQEFRMLLSSRLTGDNLSTA